MSSTEGFKRFDPPKIDTGSSKIAKDFVQNKGNSDSDFELSTLVAQQSGIAELQRQKLQKDVQDLVNVKLSEVQTQAQKEGFEKGLEEGKAKAYSDFSKALEEKAVHFDNILTLSLIHI